MNFKRSKSSLPWESQPLSLSFYFASIINWKNFIFHTLYALSILFLYGLSYFGLFSCLKGRLERFYSLKGLAFKGLFTSIIAPCIIGSTYSRYSPYFMVTSLLSDVFHSINLGGLWVTSIYCPALLWSPSNVNSTNITTNSIPFLNDLTQLFSNCSSIPQNDIELFKDTLSIFRMHCLILIPVLLVSFAISYCMYQLFKTRNWGLVQNTQTNTNQHQPE